MPKSTKVLPKKRGRPATGRDPVTAIRLSTQLAKAVDSWGWARGIRGRSEAIRQLVELGLAGPEEMRRPNPTAASKASDMAGQLIDKMADPTASHDERHTRKQRLLKGPKEFRDIRGDLPKPNK